MQETVKTTRRAGAAGRAFTMVELLVAVAIIVVMIMGFGTILSQAQRVVVTSQAMMRANAEASAVADRIRRDFEAMISPAGGGFLAMVAPMADSSGNRTHPPALIFTVMRSGAGYFARSKAFADKDITSNLAIICYSVRPDASNNNSRTVLSREVHLLEYFPATMAPSTWNAKDDPTGQRGDVMGMMMADFGDIRTVNDPGNRKYLFEVRTGYDAWMMGWFMDEAETDDPMPRRIFTMAETIDHVYMSWPIMARNCTGFGVQWIDGGLDGTGTMAARQVIGSRIIAGNALIPRPWEDRIDQWRGTEGDPDRPMRYVRARAAAPNDAWRYASITSNLINSLEVHPLNNNNWDSSFSNDPPNIDYQILGGAWHGFRSTVNPDGTLVINVDSVLDPNWTNWGFNSGEDGTGTYVMEFERPSPPRYMALWTDDNADNWPRAIKITFALNGIEYEVVCPINN